MFPLIVLEKCQHLANVCVSCPNFKTFSCGKSWCELYENRFKFWDALERADCPEKRFDLFKDSQ